MTPKLALDLEGGTQIILQPVTEGNATVTDQDITQAIDIIRQRVDASGVAEAEITSQGSGQRRNIVVGIPGTPSEETLDLVRQSAQMFFRPVLERPARPGVEHADDRGGGADHPHGRLGRELADPGRAGRVRRQGLHGPGERHRHRQRNGDPSAPLVACQSDGSESTCSARSRCRQGDHRCVVRAADDADRRADQRVGGQLHPERAGHDGVPRDRAPGCSSSSPPRNQFAIVLDGLVIRRRGSTLITQRPGGDLRVVHPRVGRDAVPPAQLRRAPAHLQVQSEQTISATLGSEQLSAGCSPASGRPGPGGGLLGGPVPRPRPGHDPQPGGRRRRDVRVDRRCCRGPRATGCRCPASPV